MVAWIGQRRNRPRDMRAEMIAETNAFLSWALSEDRRLPRIPTRLVSKGGFSEMMKAPGARGLARHWWGKALSMLER